MLHNWNEGNELRVLLGQLEHGAHGVRVARPAPPRQTVGHVEEYHVSGAHLGVQTAVQHQSEAAVGGLAPARAPAVVLSSTKIKAQNDRHHTCTNSHSM